MNILELGAIGELAGGVAVIGSLLYLAAQVRQNTNTARASADLEAAKQMADWHSRVSDNPALAALWDGAVGDSHEMDVDERRRFRWFIAEYFFMAEGLYRQYRRGLLSNDSWLPHTWLLHSLAHNEVVRGWWEGKMSPLSLDFRRYVEGLQGSDYTLPVVAPD